MTFINNDSVFDYNIKRKIAKIGKITVADGKKHQNTLVEMKIVTPWFESANKVAGLFVVPKNKCDTKAKIFGVLGIDAFCYKDILLHLNYSTLTIATTYPRDTANGVFGGYEKIKATIEDKKIFIYPQIGGSERKMLFDTGNMGAVILPYSDTLISNSKEKPIIADGVSLQSVANNFGSETYALNNQTVKIGNFSEDFPIIMLKGFDINNVGLQYIRQYNWIIDFGKNEIWMQKNEKAEPVKKIEVTNPYTALIIGSNIEIVSIVRGYDKYQLGDVILTVDGVSVNPDNICQLNKRLQETTDWSTLKIKTAKKSK
jgi:hypothetical protein